MNQLLKKVVPIIFCYGLLGYEYRSREEMKGLREYFEHCAKHIAHLYNSGRLAGVVLCGGFTNRSFPEVSEAGTSMVYLKTWLISYGVPSENIEFRLEDRSFNTPQNMWFSVQSIFRDWTELKGVSIDFICDTYRHPKLSALLFWLKVRYWGLRAQVVSFPRPDIHPDSSIEKQRFGALLYAFSPLLIWWHLRKR